MDELVSQNAALESRIAESAAIAAVQKPEPTWSRAGRIRAGYGKRSKGWTCGTTVEEKCGPQPGSGVESEAVAARYRRRNCRVDAQETVTDDTPVMEEYEEPIVDSDAIVEGRCGSLPQTIRMRLRQRCGDRQFRFWSRWSRFPEETA